MIVREAVNDIVRKLSELDDRELAATGQRVAQLDRTWDEWCNELSLRNSYLLADGPSQDVLDALGAIVIAFKLKLAEAEETRVGSGWAA